MVKYECLYLFCFSYLDRPSKRDVTIILENHSGSDEHPLDQECSILPPPFLLPMPSENSSGFTSQSHHLGRSIEAKMERVSVQSLPV